MRETPQEKIMRLKASGVSYSRIGSRLKMSDTAVQHMLSKDLPKAAGKCAKCGTTKRLVNHHYDYTGDKVFILCVTCHAKVHTAKGNAYFVGYDNMPNSHINKRREKLAKKNGTAPIDDYQI